MWRQPGTLLFYFVHLEVVFPEIQVLKNVGMKFISIALSKTKHHVQCTPFMNMYIGYTKVHADMACKRPVYFLI